MPTKEIMMTYEGMKKLEEELEKLLMMLAEKGPDVTEKYIRTKLLKNHPGARIAEYFACRNQSK